MMSFLDIRFPVRIAMNCVGGPGFSTNIAIMASGAESRNQEWTYERGEWEASQAAKLPEEYKPLQAFFRNAAGRANTWRFKDWTDFEADATEGVFISTNIGSPSGMQMVKRYTFGAYTYDRIISKPVSGTITLTGGSGSIDYDNGVHHGSATGWYGEFDCHCRFDTDRMRRESVDRNLPLGLIVSWESIPIVEVKDEVV